MDLAHLAVENGADVIMGHHPHWIQTSEIYLDKPIYYSLGNLVFDQFWSEPTMRGLLVKLEFTARRNFQGGYEVDWQVMEEIEVDLSPPGQPKVLEHRVPAF